MEFANAANIISGNKPAPNKMPENKADSIVNARVMAIGPSACPQAKSVGSSPGAKRLGGRADAHGCLGAMGRPKSHERPPRRNAARCKINIIAADDAVCHRHEP